MLYAHGMEKPPKPKMHVLGVRVDEATKAAIETAAAADQRSISQWLAIAARAALRVKEIDDVR
jgi:uncharacterized protein (DUF1778 family)